MANTIELQNVDGEQVGVRWSYETPIAGVSSDDDAVLAIDGGGGGHLPTDSHSLGHLLGFDTLEQVNVAPDLFNPADSISIYAYTGGGLVYVAGPVGWPEIVPDVPPNYIYSGWSNIASLTYGVVNLPVLNLTATKDATNFYLEWDKYTPFIAEHYVIQWKRADDNIWLGLAIIAATDDARNSYFGPFSSLIGAEELDELDFRVRARRTGE